MTLQPKPLDAFLEVLDLQNAGVHPLLLQRTSRANFAPEALDRRQIIQLLQAARCAPSSHNSQPWYFIVVRNGPGRAEIDQSLAAAGASWAAQAPVLLAVVVNPDQGTQHNGLNYCLFDAGLAVQNILLQAAGMGLSAHPVNYSSPEIMKRVLNLPQPHQLLLFIALGRPNGEVPPTESSRLRKPLAAIASWDRWDGSPVLE